VNFGCVQQARLAQGGLDEVQSPHEAPTQMSPERSQEKSPETFDVVGSHHESLKVKIYDEGLLPA
jgi:hypothetical protein